MSVAGVSVLIFRLPQTMFTPLSPERQQRLRDIKLLILDVDGVLTVDNPVETISPLQQELQKHGLDAIFLVAPTTSEERMAEIGRLASGFVYYVSLKGVTGSAQLNTDEVAAKIAVLRRHISLPIGVGFGISDAESARKIGAVADAVIVGSRIVKEIENNAGSEAKAVGALVKSLKQAVEAV